ncbi:hypothetical protein LOTGIDRAFT_160052 [Lottia gigantea]|uniref:Ty3 transposon capsid-like protein domain-containing protein n=1 Tax=Lottia gigantea TaxID=225164 RepID=V3ZX16_LOTGI|nr:hypothetical protein LOTGIDRAFT_160052 [Lottia gigantea]ESO96068.1 hypothetical protein LOTGIDRAFT_160052 [Lottia gigantea]
MTSEVKDFYDGFQTTPCRPRLFDDFDMFDSIGMPQPTPRRELIIEDDTPVPTVAAACNVTLRISKFDGIDCSKVDQFLAEFNLSATLDGIKSDSQKIAAFHLCLKGPAAKWFLYLEDSSKTDWRNFMRAFMSRFSSDSDNMKLAENVAFNNITLLPKMSLTELHSLILEKGSKLKKTEFDFISKFIDSLPPTLSFFVRARNPNTLLSALNAAQMGELYGYSVNSKHVNYQNVPPFNHNYAPLSQQLPMPIYQVPPHSSSTLCSDCPIATHPYPIVQSTYAL